MNDNDRVLLALAHASGGGRNAVPYEEIVIESWRRFPERFSLRNHPEHPNSSEQHKRLYGALKKAGYVEVVDGEKAFRLTDAGWERASQLDQSL